MLKSLVPGPGIHQKNLGPTVTKCCSKRHEEMLPEGCEEEIWAQMCKRQEKQQQDLHRPPNIDGYLMKT